MFMRTTKYRQYAIKAVIKLIPDPQAQSAPCPSVCSEIGDIDRHRTRPAEAEQQQAQEADRVDMPSAYSSVTRPESRAVRSPSR